MKPEKVVVAWYAIALIILFGAWGNPLAFWISMGICVTAGVWYGSTKVDQCESIQKHVS